MEPILLTLRVKKEWGAPAVSSRQGGTSAGQKPLALTGCFSTRSCRVPRRVSYGLRWSPSLPAEGGGFLLLRGSGLDAEGREPEPAAGGQRKKGSYRHACVHRRRQ